MITVVAILAHIVDFDGHGEFLGKCPDAFIKQFVLILQRKDKVNNAPLQTEAEYTKQAQIYWDKAHKKLHDYLFKDSQDKLILFFSGSSRVDLSTDQICAADKGNGSCFSLFKEFCAQSSMTFFPSLLADFDHMALPGKAMEDNKLKAKGYPGREELVKMQDDLEEGDPRIAILPKVLYVIDEYYNKIRMIAYSLRMIAMKYPNSSSVTCRFSDGRYDILEAVDAYLRMYPKLIPPNIRLELWHPDYNIEAPISAHFFHIQPDPEVLVDIGSLSGNDFPVSVDKDSKYEPRHSLMVDSTLRSGADFGITNRLDSQPATEIKSSATRLNLASISKNIGLNSPVAFFSPDTTSSPFGNPETYGFAVKFTPPNEKIKILGRGVV